jgi:hypothetical protein
MKTEFVKNLKGRHHLKKPRHRWEDNIKVYLKEIHIWTGLMWLTLGTGGSVLLKL